MIISLAGKEFTCNAGDPSLILGLGRSTRERKDRLPTPLFLGFPGASEGKESACNAGDLSLIPKNVGKITWRREQLPTPVSLPGEFHGQRSLTGYSP